MRQDKVIAILKGNGGAKRAARKAQVELTVWADGTGWVLQSNGKELESGEGPVENGVKRAEERAKAIRALGKTCNVITY